MDHSKFTSQPQVDIRAHGQIDAFFNRFRIGTLLHQCGIRKRHGHSVRFLTQTIFTLSFTGQNFYRGIVLNPDLPFGKDAAYELLKGVRHNWRKLILALARRIFLIFNRLTNENRESVFIIDDSVYDRARSKTVELLSRVYDHSTGKYTKGFRILTLCWSDGASCLPVDFALLSSSDAQKRLCQNNKAMDRRCCAHRRRSEATMKATAHLNVMVNRALKAGLTARYLLMDSWFTMPATVTALADSIPVIGMVKKIRTVHYRFQGHSLAKEIQCRDFDALIGHTSIVFMRYMFLAYHCRLSTDQRSFGDLFHACCDEIRDISFLEALMRILTLAMDRMRAIGSYCQKTFDAFFFVAMEITLNTLGIGKNNAISFSANPES